MFSHLQLRRFFPAPVLPQPPSRGEASPPAGFTAEARAESGVVVAALTTQLEFTVRADGTFFPACAEHFLAS